MEENRQEFILLPHYYVKINLNEFDKKGLK